MPRINKQPSVPLANAICADESGIFLTNKPTLPAMTLAEIN